MLVILYRTIDLINSFRSFRYHSFGWHFEYTLRGTNDTVSKANDNNKVISRDLNYESAKLNYLPKISPIPEKGSFNAEI